MSIFPKSLVDLEEDKNKEADRVQWTQVDRIWRGSIDVRTFGGTRASVEEKPW